jgi:ABC-2 type transport system permease protein
MLTMVKHSNHLALRSLRFLRREPIYLAFTLVQPAVWLLLFGEVFKRVVDIPGFGDTSYIVYLTPGVIVMTAMMNAGWAGTSFIEDMDRGVMDRYLTSPVSRAALINGTLVYQGVVTLVQSLIVFGLGFAMGARYDDGVLGIALVLVVAVLLATIFSAFSCAMALVMRTQEALIGVFQFLSLPLAFLSSVLMAPALLPGWVGTVATYNPVDWAAVASREALASVPDWGEIASRLGLLVGVVAVMAWLATRAFRSYQQAV